MPKASGFQHQCSTKLLALVIQVIHNTNMFVSRICEQLLPFSLQWLEKGADNSNNIMVFLLITMNTTTSGRGRTGTLIFCRGVFISSQHIIVVYVHINDQRFILWMLFVSYLWLWHRRTLGWHRGQGCLAVSREWLSRRSKTHLHFQPKGNWRSQRDPEHPGDRNEYRNWVSLVFKKPTIHAVLSTFQNKIIMTTAVLHDSSYDASDVQTL